MILLNLCGHGHFDMAAFDDYLNGRLPEVEFVPEDEVWIDDDVEEPANGAAHQLGHAGRILDPDRDGVPAGRLGG